MSALVYGASASAALTLGTTGDADILASRIRAGGQAITITSAIYSGSLHAAATYTEGPLGIADGILLTTGQAFIALPPSDSGAAGADNALPGDPLCDALIPGFQSHDATKLTITFDLAPGFDGISFQSIFGTEEYQEYVGSTYNDVYAVYLNGAQVVFDDAGNPITVNGPFFSSEAVIVAPETQCEYDGSTSLLTTRAPLLGPSVNNVLEIVICDAGDHVLDSGVFLANLNGCIGVDCSGTLPCGLVDGDGDGATSCDDCDDTDPTVHAGAFGICCEDGDGDGVCDDEDACPDTEPTEPNPTLGVNQWSTGGEGGDADTTSPPIFGRRRSHTIVDTDGCSCAQSLEGLGFGEEDAMQECSIGGGETWGG